MIDATHTTCDICSTVKGANSKNWLVASQVDEQPGILFIPADSVRRDLPHVKIQDICGEACAAKRLSQYCSTL